MHPDESELTRLPAEKVESVLRRAAELDSDGTGSLTLHEIRSVAEEAGISVTAVDAAYHEMNEDAAAAANSVTKWSVTALIATASVSYVIWWAGAIASDGVAGSDAVGLVAGTGVVAAVVYGLGRFGFWAKDTVMRHFKGE